ncbi:MAG: hypothetical protein ACRC0L_12130, partial [Angustibacter sp.]
MTVLKAWLSNPHPQNFPHSWVVEQFQTVGKHFTSADTLEDLKNAQKTLTEKSTGTEAWLLAFLGNALDKHENRFDYASYLGLNLLALPRLDHPVEHSDYAQPKCDRITLGITADLLRLELTAAATQLRRPILRLPDEALTAKRVRLALRAMTPALNRSAIYQTHELQFSARGADRVQWAVEGELSRQERRAIALTMLPVHTEHDEYLFIRVLQACETFFALIGSQLRGALAAFERGEAEHGIHFLARCERAFS